MHSDDSLYGPRSGKPLSSSDLVEQPRQPSLVSPPKAGTLSPKLEEDKIKPGKVGKLDSSGIIHLDITISHKELKLFEPPLGDGGYGVVYRGLWKEQEVAVKKLKVQTISEDALKELRKEAEIMFQMGIESPYVVPVKKICLEAPHYSLVMELMPKGSLYQLLRNKSQDLPWPVRYQIALDVSYGLRDLHARAILHRDLKSLNILLDDRLRAKLIDFGLAKVKQETASQSTQAKGTPQWMAPELFDDEPKMTPECDIYSLGMVLWELASRQIPFVKAPNQQVVIGWIMRGKKEQIPSDCPAELKSLIESCWELPTKRPTAVQVAESLKPLVAVKQKKVEPTATAVLASLADLARFGSPILITEEKEKQPAPSELTPEVGPVVTLPPVEGKAVYSRLLQATLAKLTARLPDLAFYLPPTVIKALPEGISVEDLMTQLNAVPSMPVEEKQVEDKTVDSTASSPKLTLFVKEKVHPEETDEKKRMLKTSPGVGQSTSPPPSRALPVAAVIDTFLAQEENLLLLLGEPGAGKSLTTWHTIRRLVEEGETKTGSPPKSLGWLPIPVELNQLTVSQLPGLIERELKAAGLSEGGIRQGQQPPSEEKPVPKLLLILDGYDELRQDSGSHRDQTDLFKTIGGEAWPVGQLKVLITCRRSFLNSLAEEEMVFGVGHYQRYQRYELLPFTLRQIESYIEARSRGDVGGGLLKPKDYLQLLQSSESLRQVVQNPFVLHLFLEALPGLSQTGIVAMQELVRFDLYAAFFDQWLKREVRRLPSTTKTALGRKDHATLVQDFKRMAMVVASQMFVANSLWIRVDPMSSYSPATQVWTAALEHIALEAKLEYQQLDERVKRSMGSLFGSLTASGQGLPTQDEFMRQAQRRAEQLIHVLPVTRSGNEYRWVHKSLYEYLVAEGLLTLIENKTPLAGAMLTCFNQRPIQTEPEVVYFLREWLSKPAQAKRRQVLINTGRHLIERSKEEQEITQASANAMTLLNALCVSFAYADLRGVRIPGADMAQGLFDHADFRGADLQDVNFQDACLSHAKLSGVKTKGLYLQEDVVMEWKLRNNQIAKSPDGLWLVFYGNKENPASAYLYSVAEKRVVTPKGIGEKIAQAVFSNDGRCLALCGSHQYTSPAYIYQCTTTGWRLATPEKGVGSHIQRVQFSNDSRWLLLDAYLQYQIADCQTDVLQWTIIEVSSSYCRQQLFSPDNKWLLFREGGPDINKLHVWTCEGKGWKAVTPEQIEYLKGFREVQFSANSHWLVVQLDNDSKDPDVLFSCQEGKLQPMALAELGKPLRKIRISDDRQGLMFCTDEQNVVYLANAADEKLTLKTVTVELKPRIIDNEEMTFKLESKSNILIDSMEFPTPHYFRLHYAYYSKIGKCHYAGFNVYLVKQENEWKTVAHTTLSGEQGQYSPNGQWLALFHLSAGLISLKDNSEVSLPQSLEKLYPYAAQFSTDSQWLIFYKCSQQPAYLLTYRNKQWELSATLGNKEQSIIKVHFSVDGRWLFGYAGDAYKKNIDHLVVFDLQLGKEHSFSLSLDIPFQAVLLLPDNIHWLLAAGSRCYVGKVGQAGLRCLLELPSRILELHCLASSEYIGIQTEDGITVIKDWQRLLAPLQQGLLTRKGRKEAGQTLSLLTDAAPWVITGGRDTLLWRVNHTIDYVSCLPGRKIEVIHPRSQHVWMATQTGLYILNPNGLMNSTPENWQRIWEQEPTQMIFSNDGQWLVLVKCDSSCGSRSNNFMNLLRCTQGKPQEWKPPEYREGGHWQFSPDQQWLMVVYWKDKHLLVCKSSHPQWKPLGMTDITRDEQFSPDNRWFVVLLSFKHSIEIYNIQQLDWITPEECKSMTEINKFLFSPDSHWLVLLGKTEIYLLNYEEKQSKWALTAEYKDVQASEAQFSADSRWLVLHGFETPTYVLDCREAKPKWVTPKGGINQGNKIVFSADSTVLGVLHPGYKDSKGSGILALNGTEPDWLATQESVGAAITDLVYSSDGQWMVMILKGKSTQGHYGAIFGYQNNQWKLLEKINYLFYNAIFSNNTAFSSDNRYLVLYGGKESYRRSSAYVLVGSQDQWKRVGVPVEGISTYRDGELQGEESRILPLHAKRSAWLMRRMRTKKLFPLPSAGTVGKKVIPEQGWGQHICKVEFSNDQRWILLQHYQSPRHYIFCRAHHYSISLTHSLESQLTLYRGATVFHDKNGCLLLLDRPTLSVVPELPALSERKSQPYAVYVYPQKIIEGISSKISWSLTYFAERLAGGESLTVINELITDPLLIAGLDAANGDRDKLTFYQQEQLLTKVPDYDRIFVRYLLANMVIRDVKIFNQHYVAMICGDGSLRIWDLRDPRRPALCATSSMSFYAQSVDVNEVIGLSEFNRQLLTKSSADFQDKTYKVKNGKLVEEKEIESKMTVAPEKKVEVTASPKKSKQVDRIPIKTELEQKAFLSPERKIESPAPTAPSQEPTSHGKEAKIAEQPEIVSTLKQKLASLCEENDYTFELKRPGSQQLLIQFTAKEDILAGVEEIKTELIALVKLFQQTVISLGIKILKVKPNWQNWTLTLTADTASLDKIAELLAEMGVKYFVSLAQAKSALFYKPSASTGKPAGSASEMAAATVTCKVQ